MPRRFLWLAVVVTLAGASRADAQETATGESAPAVTLRTSIKASALLSRTPDAPELFAERVGAESVWRIRLEPTVRLGPAVTVEAAYEQRLRAASGARGVATAGILPSTAAAPYRIEALDWSLADSPGASWRHEIDRASLQVHGGRADLTIGRQAIGWGRGVIFGAVDLFAPFSPLEADREWRRGVDAVRVDVKLSDRTSVDLVGAFGTSLAQSVVAARARGFAGPVDLEVMAGKRAEDWFGGVTSSAAVGDAEIHGELAAFRVPDGPAGERRDVRLKAVVGGSYRLAIGAGILAYAEYHYSGFGAARPGDILPLMSSPSFAARYLRGDTQILSRHAVAITALYEPSPELAYNGQWIHNPVDRSGIVAPGVTWTLSDQLSLVATVYWPYGRPPSGARLLSEYGSGARSALLQLRLYP